MATKKGQIVWNGKNFAEVRAFHKGVAQYPADPKGTPYHRDASQDPNNLHLTTDEGHTVVVALGDTIGRDESGKLVVTQTGKQRPQATPVTPAARLMSAEGRDGLKGKGGTR